MRLELVTTGRPVGQEQAKGAQSFLAEVRLDQLTGVLVHLESLESDGGQGMFRVDDGRAIFGAHLLGVGQKLATLRGPM